MEQVSLVCPKCTLPVLAAFYFCPNCGKQLRPKPIELSFPKIIGVCLLSFFFPPFGLHPAIRYIRQPNTTTKVVGWVAIMLTILAYIFAIFSLITLMGRLTTVLNNAGNMGLLQ